MNKLTMKELVYRKTLPFPRDQGTVPDSVDTTEDISLVDSPHGGM